MEEKELLDIVDEKDNVIGQDTKENKFKKGLISRNVAVFILDDDNKLIITKRSPYKDSFPDRYDLAACGNVKAGESYMEAANREVLEELNVKCDLNFLDKIYNEFEEGDNLIKYFTGIFLAHYSGEVELNDELVELKRYYVKEVEGMIKDDEDLFTPRFVNDFVYVKDKLM